MTPTSSTLTPSLENLPPIPEGFELDPEFNAEFNPNSTELQSDIQPVIQPVIQPETKPIATPPAEIPKGILEGLPPIPEGYEIDPESIPPQTLSVPAETEVSPQIAPPAKPAFLDQPELQPELQPKPQPKERGILATAGAALGVGVTQYIANRLMGASVYGAPDSMMKKASESVRNWVDPETVQLVNEKTGGKLDMTDAWGIIKQLPRIGVYGLLQNSPQLMDAIISQQVGKTLGPLVGLMGANPATVAAGAVLGGHMAGAASSGLTEAGSFKSTFLPALTAQGIDDETANMIVDKYARIYGPAAGIVEYASNIYQLGKATKGIRRQAVEQLKKTPLWKVIFDPITGGLSEGGEEITQGWLQNRVSEMMWKEADILYGRKFQHTAQQALLPGGIAGAAVGVTMQAIGLPASIRAHNIVNTQLTREEQENIAKSLLSAPTQTIEQPTTTEPKPTKPTKPIAPVQPIEPIEPTGPVAPIEPVTKPIAPSAPAEPAQPAQPVAPAEQPIMQPVKRAPEEIAREEETRQILLTRLAQHPVITGLPNDQRNAVMTALENYKEPLVTLNSKKLTTLIKNARTSLRPSAPTQQPTPPGEGTAVPLVAPEASTGALLKHNAIQTRLKEIKNKLGIQVLVKRNPSELTLEERGDATGDADPALFVRNKKTGKIKVYVFSDNNADVDKAVASYYHEVAGHGGLRAITNNDDAKMNTILDGITGVKERQTRINEIAALYKFNLKTDQGRRNAAQEYFAEQVELGRANPTLWAKIRTSLKLFFGGENINLSDADLDVLINRAYDASLTSKKAAKPTVAPVTPAQPAAPVKRRQRIGTIQDRIAITTGTQMTGMEYLTKEIGGLVAHKGGDLSEEMYGTKGKGGPVTINLRGKQGRGETLDVAANMMIEAGFIKADPSKNPTDQLLAYIDAHKNDAEMVAMAEDAEKNMGAIMHAQEQVQNRQTRRAKAKELWAQHRLMRSGDKVDTSQMHEGDTFTLHGERFFVEREEDTGLIVKDGKEIPVPYEQEWFYVDKDSYKKAGTPEALQAGGELLPKDYKEPLSLIGRLQADEARIAREQQSAANKQAKLDQMARELPLEQPSPSELEIRQKKRNLAPNEKTTYFNALKHRLEKEFDMPTGEILSILEKAEGMNNVAHWGDMVAKQKDRALDVLEQKIAELSGDSRPSEAAGTIETIRAENEVPTEDTDRSAANIAVEMLRGIQRGEVTRGVTQEDRAEILSRVSPYTRRIDPNDEVINRILNVLPYPLETDPNSRRSQLIFIEKWNEQAARAKYYAEHPDQRSLTFRFTNLMRGFASRFQIISDLATDSVTPRLYDVDMRRNDTRKFSTVAVDTDRDASYQRANVKRNIDAYVAADPILSMSIRQLLGIDPNTKDKDLTQLRQNAETYLNSNPRAKEIRRVMKEIRDYTTGSGRGATILRSLMIKRFGAMWSGRLGDIYESLSAIPKENRTDKQKAQLSAVTSRLKAVLPYFAEEEVNDEGDVEVKPQQISIDEAKHAWDILREHGRDAFEDYLSRQTWGTRKYYYMSKPDISDYASDLVNIDENSGMGEFGGLTESESRQLVPLAGATKRREKLPNFKQGGNPFADIWRHNLNIRVQNDTFEDTRYVAENLNRLVDEGYLSKSQARGLFMGMRTDWGAREFIEDIPKIAYTVGRPAWTAFSLILDKLGYYTIRNIGYQGVPWGGLATAHRAIDIASVFTKDFKSQMLDTNSEVHKAWRTNRPAISEAQQRFYEGTLMLTPPEQAATYNKHMASFVEKLWRIQAASLGVSDEGNRFMIFAPSYAITKKHTEAYQRGDINLKELEDRLMLGALPPAMRIQLNTLIQQGKETGDFSQFITETAKLKTLLVNFAYATTERSAWEQDPNMRIITGMSVFPRGTIEQYYRTGIEPLIKSFKNWQHHGFKAEHFDAPVVATAWRNILANSISRYLASYILAQFIGERVDFQRKKKRGFYTAGSFDVADAILGYRTGGMGGSMALGIFNAAEELMYTITNLDGDEFDKKAKALGDKLLYFTVVVPTLKTFFEAIGDRRGMKNCDALLSIAHGQIQGGRGKERNFYEALMHVLFATEPVDKNKEIMDTYNDVKSLLEPEPKYH